MTTLPDYIEAVKAAHNEVYFESEEALPPTLQDLLVYVTSYEPSDELDKSLSFWMEIVATCARIYTGLHNDNYPNEFWTALKERLELDHIRWGNTWLTRTIEKQSERCKHTFTDYASQFENALEVDDVELLLKVAGNAYICALRLLLPDYKAT